MPRSSRHDANKIHNDRKLGQEQGDAIMERDGQIRESALIIARKGRVDGRASAERVESCELRTAKGQECRLISLYSLIQACTLGCILSPYLVIRPHSERICKSFCRT